MSNLTIDFGSSASQSSQHIIVCPLFCAFVYKNSHHYLQEENKQESEIRNEVASANTFETQCELVIGIFIGTNLSEIFIYYQKSQTSGEKEMMQNALQKTELYSVNCFILAWCV